MNLLLDDARKMSCNALLPCPRQSSSFRQHEVSRNELHKAVHDDQRSCSILLADNENKVADVNIEFRHQVSSTVSLFPLQRE
ncbi:hypothetical protein JAAARDRAFT_37179 [Jaapia argillacea MUCL 33604]|uniref:Uncharacterized protein n=1 Tax=Jaapia argillacea MUCL 33604 TaxID=933084 RepID=A0A067PLI2_9AGAM|nr:hypothetical protein JAAARDRAFT_37179 [Jaapia argillacea MUCL 33604]